MRLAIISSRFPAGKSEPYLASEIRALEARGEHVIVLAVRQRGFAELAATFTFALRTVRRSPLAVLRSLGTVMSAAARPAVRLKNLAVFPRALAIAEHVRRTRADHVHAYWLSTPATVAMIVSQLNEIPWSTSAHRWDIFEDNLIARKASSASFIRAISERGRRELLRRTHEHGSPIHVVRLGTALVTERRRATAARNAVLLCAAAFVPVKGHSDLLRAFAAARAQEPALRLVLAGVGPLRATMERLVRRLEITDAVEFAGYIDRTRLLGDLAAGAYGAVVLASRDRGSETEGVPSILIEATSLGVPCIATLSGGVGELLDESCGYTAHAGDVESITTALLRWWRGPEEATRRSGAAQKRTRTLHDPDRVAERLSRLMGGLNVPTAEEA